MKSLDALFRGGPSTASTRATIFLPDDEPAAPAELINPHGFGRVWRRDTGPTERPAVYTRIG